MKIVFSLGPLNSFSRSNPAFLNITAPRSLRERIYSQLTIAQSWKRQPLRGRNRQGARYSWMFPNMTFAAGTEAIWVYEAYPLAPDRTRVGMTLCFPAATVARPDFEARAQHYYDRFDTALAEDIPMLERQQAGMTSPFARQGRYSDLEPSVAAFAFWYAQNLLES